MKVITNNLYSKIPLVDRLNSMSMNKLRKYAWKYYGIMFNPIPGADKNDLIQDILYTEKEFSMLKDKVIKNDI